jgi:hypothetical protein
MRVFLLWQHIKAVQNIIVMMGSANVGLGSDVWKLEPFLIAHRHVLYRYIYYVFRIASNRVHFNATLRRSSPQCCSAIRVHGETN